MNTDYLTQLLWVWKAEELGWMILPQDISGVCSQEIVQGCSHVQAY